VQLQLKAMPFLYNPLNTRLKHSKDQQLFIEMSLAFKPSLIVKSNNLPEQPYRYHYLHTYIAHSARIEMYELLI